jgi:tRNA-dihydrouridine synthase B
VVQHHHGAWLLREPDLAAEVVAATVDGTHLPVSAKIRLGWDSLTADSLAPKLVEAGARALIVHGRTRDQQYRGSVSLEGIAAVRRAVDVPVVANGDVRTVDDARRMLDSTGAAGIMVGRGAVGNPWLFARLQAELKCDRRYLDVGLDELDLMRWHADLAFEDQPDLAHLSIRKHLIGYARGHPGSAALRRATASLRTREDVGSWIDEHEVSRAVA